MPRTRRLLQPFCDPSCAWEPTIQRCYVKKDGFPCEDVFEEKDCAAQVRM
jgi:hypothetical protein